MKETPMPTYVPAKLKQQGGANFKIIDAEDIEGSMKVGVGPPTMQAAIGTVYLDRRAQKIYYNADGLTQWKLIVNAK